MSPDTRADSNSKRALEFTPGQFAKRGELLKATPVAIHENSRKSNIVHDTLIQDIQEAACAEQQAWQQDPTLSKIKNVVAPSSEKAKIESDKLSTRFFQSHGFWPWQTVDEPYTPKQWSPRLLKAFLKIPNDMTLTRLRHLLKTTVDERVGGAKGRRVTAADISTLVESEMWTSSCMSPSSSSLIVY